MTTMATMTAKKTSLMQTSLVELMATLCSFAPHAMNDQAPACLKLAHTPNGQFASHAKVKVAVVEGPISGLDAKYAAPGP
jgi:hypothetical protein